jgi:hypothetical protein
LLSEAVSLFSVETGMGSVRQGGKEALSAMLGHTMLTSSKPIKCSIHVLADALFDSNTVSLPHFVYEFIMWFYKWVRRLLVEFLERHGDYLAGDDGAPRVVSGDGVDGHDECSTSHLLGDAQHSSHGTDDREKRLDILAAWSPRLRALLRNCRFEQGGDGHGVALADSTGVDYQIYTRGACGSLLRIQYTEYRCY